MRILDTELLYCLQIAFRGLHSGKSYYLVLPKNLAFMEKLAKSVMTWDKNVAKTQCSSEELA